MRQKLLLLLFALGVLLASGCRKNDTPSYLEKEQTSSAPDPNAKVVGMYVLNNGGKGNNETTLDYYDFTTSIYYRNIYGDRNPESLSSLGDNGVDIAVHDGLLYVVMNGSHKVLILNAKDARYISEIHVNDCRSIAFHNGFGYITSYLRPGNGAHKNQGEVVKFDLSTRKIVGRASLGEQPDKMVIFQDSYLFVGNSGVYTEEYDNRVSTVDLESFRQVSMEPVGPQIRNMLVTDLFSSIYYLWVATLGNGQGIAPRLYKIGWNKDQETLDSVKSGNKGGIDISVIDMLYNEKFDNQYIYALTGDLKKNGWIEQAAFIKVKATGSIQSEPWKIETQNLEHPNSIAQHPVSGDYIVTDAKNYTTSGAVYCFDKKGAEKWHIRTGVEPVKVAFVLKTP